MPKFRSVYVQLSSPGLDEWGFTDYSKETPLLSKKQLKNLEAEELRRLNARDDFHVAKALAAHPADVE